jgi:hypothetical protein
MKRISDSKKYNYSKSKQNDLKPSIKGVSEAIGTILLLSISVSLVGVLAYWVHSLPSPEEFIEADLGAKIMLENNQYILLIEHTGGEAFDVDKIEVLIEINGVSVWKNELFYSAQTIFDNGLWEIGEVWTKNINTFHNWNLSLPEVAVDVKDISSNSLILTGKVDYDVSFGILPDLKVGEEDITFEFLNSTLRNSEWVNISARIHNLGGSAVGNVIVRFFDGSQVIPQDNKDYRYITSIGAGSYQTVWVNWTPIHFGVRSINVKVYSGILEENFNNNYASKRLTVDPTIPTITGPNLEIEDILFSPITPTHGDWVTITVMVKNIGDEEVPAGTDLNLSLWDEEGYLLTKDVIFTFNRTLTSNITQFESLKPAFVYSSQTTYGGKTKIKAQITASIEESRLDDNFMDKFIQILPTILLVDDDGLFELYTREDTSSYMDAALQLAVGSGQFDIWNVKGANGPKFESGDKPLRNYDIVIWMTGYQTTNTLSKSDRDAITQYLENNGKLWLIGMNIIEDLRIQAALPPGIVSDFTRDYLGVADYQLTGTPDFLYGVIGENLTEGMILNTSNLIKARDNGVNLTLRQSKVNQSISGILGNDAFFGQDGNMSLKYYNQTANYTYKVVFFSWEFASIIDMINRNNLTIQILKWFGWELEIGTDLAIASKGFSDQTPNFMDWIEISARVRNNGPRDLSRIRVDFFKIDSDGQETRIPEYPNYKDPENPQWKDWDNPQYIFIEGDGGDREVKKKWLAVDVGRHTFRVVVDIEDEIEEVSEENNDDFYSPLFVTQLVIGYTILLVDDDNSTNNGGTEPNATQELADTLDELGYVYDNWVIVGAPIPQSGPNITVMKHYNSVIWCTGYDDVNTLLLNDQNNLTDYFTRNFPEANFLGETRMNTWIVGQGILNDLGGIGAAVTPPPGSFLYDYLKVQQYSTIGGKVPSVLDGMFRDNITHGLSYPMLNSVLDEGDIIIPTSDAKGIFWQDAAHTKFNNLRYNSSTHHLVFTPWVFSLIDDSTTLSLQDESYKSELSYLIMRWFSYPDDRFELKTSTIDIELSNYNPILGNAYIIRSNIFNLGINDTNAIVRFLDGDTVIDTKSVFVPANGNSTTEVIWSPLFAGYRNIRIAVDPDNDTEEVFDVLNNNATLEDQIVYFFFDDMENGTGNWNHDNTIVMINAESPLEYMDPPVHSNVNNSWDPSDSQGFIVTEDEYRSYSQSFYTFEPIGLRKKSALDIVFVLDTSSTMSGQALIDMKKAVRNFINLPMLDARDRVAIYSFVSEAPNREINFTLCDMNGKQLLINTVNNLNSSGFKPLWDSIGEGVTYLKNQGSTRKPIVIALTSGADVGNEGLEDGSETFSPWHNWSDTGVNVQYNNVDSTAGHDHFTYNSGDPNTFSNWVWANLDDENRFGLLNISNVTVYTVGMGIRHDNHTSDSCYWYPDGWNGSYAKQEDDENNWAGNYNLSIYDESGSTEYNLWRVANMSGTGGDYFYASNSSKIKNAFSAIAEIILSETIIHRSATTGTTESSARSANTRGNTRARAPRAQLFFDGLETGDYTGGPWTVGTGWSVQSGGNQYAGIYYSRARGSATDSSMAMSSDLDLSDYKNVNLIIYHYASGVESADTIYIDISTNSGSSWVTLQTWSGSTIEFGNYRRFEYNLSAYDQKPSIRIRFRFSMNQANDYWLVDNIEIIGDKVTSGGGGSGGIGNDTSDPLLWLPGDRNLTSNPFSLVNVTSAKLTFYHKYNLRLGLNGVVVLVGTTNTSAPTNWSYEYVRPTQPYNNNFLASKRKYDDYGREMRWCWNGVSGNGKYTWDYIEVDLNNWTSLSQVRIRIAFLWAGPGVGGGYFIDDFKVTVARNESLPLTASSVDQWNLTNVHSHSGNSAWWNRNITTGNLSGGLDNSLYTRPIDLTNARNATFSAYFKFNINTASGRPPDGFRVEISSDHGITWRAINMGARSSWGVSGNDSDADDGIPNDGKAYTGLDVYGDDTVTDDWVEAGTLTRLNTDITGWAGEVIILRIRVVTASDNNPYFRNHCEDPMSTNKGLMVDDVIIFGSSLLN